MKLNITSGATDDAADFALLLANSDDPARQPSDLLTDRDGASALLRAYLLEDEDSEGTAEELIAFRDVLRLSLLDAAADREVQEEHETQLSAALALPWRVTAVALEGSVASFAPEGPAAERLSAWAALGYFALLHGARDRLRTCASDPCEEIFRDDTKSGRQRFCSKRCANRFNVARHRARQTVGRD